MGQAARGGRVALSLSVLAVALLVVAPASARAATVTNAWSARIGSGGANGTATLQLYATGQGSLALKLAKLPKSTSLAVTLYKGTCSSVGTVLVKVPALKTSSAGAAARTSGLTASQVTSITKATTGTGKIAIRVGRAATGGIKCGSFTAFPAPPSGWAFLSWSDPVFQLALPAGWGSVEPWQTKWQPAALASLSPEQRRNAELWNSRVSSGMVRLVATGDLVIASGTVPGAEVDVYVETGDTSLPAAADRDVRETRDMIPGVTIAQSTARTPAGDAVAINYSGKVGDWPSFSAIDYILRLADGRTLTVAFTGSDKAADPSAVAAFATKSIATLSPALACPPVAAHPGLSGRIAFVGTNAICVADLKTGAVGTIYRSTVNIETITVIHKPLSWLDWSPDGRQLAFVRASFPASGPPSDELVIVNADGTGLHAIPSPPNRTDYHGVSWSPRGDRIAVSVDSRGCTGCASIFVLDVAHGTWAPLGSGGSVGFDVESPDWAPDGHRLVAMVAGWRNERLEPSVGVITDSGGLITTLPPKADYTTSVAWSDNGRSIAVASFFIDGKDELSIVSPDGSSSRSISPLADTDHVRWVFGDTALLMHRLNAAGTGSIWVVPLDGSGPYPLFYGADPAWIDN